MSNRVSKSNSLQVLFALVALALIVSLPSALHAQTFQTVPALSFTMPFAGANPLPQIVTIATTSGALRFTPVASTSSGGNWLSVSPSNLGCCNAPYPVAVLVNGAGLAAGTYNGQILAQSTTTGDSTTINVSLVVTGSVTVTPSGADNPLTFNAVPSGSTSAPNVR